MTQVNHLECVITTYDIIIDIFEALSISVSVDEEEEKKKEEKKKEKRKKTKVEEGDTNKDKKKGNSFSLPPPACLLPSLGIEDRKSGNDA